MTQSDVDMEAALKDAEESAVRSLRERDEAIKEAEQFRRVATDATARNPMVRELEAVIRRLEKDFELIRLDFRLLQTEARMLKQQAKILKARAKLLE